MARSEWSAGALPLDPQNDSYAYRKNIAMLIDSGFSFDEINQAAKDLYDERNLGGVFLENYTQKVWVTGRNTERKGYEIYARSLKITASDDSSYWEWKRESHPRDLGRNADIEVAYMKAIKWLEARGKFSTVKLTARTRYKVYFILKTVIIDGKSWEKNLQVTFWLYVPNMGRQERQQNLKITNDYEKYEVGEFCLDKKTIGTIEFHMEQFDPSWKHGLVIKGVRIEPQL